MLRLVDGDGDVLLELDAEECKEFYYYLEEFTNEYSSLEYPEAVNVMDVMRRVVFRA